MKPLLLPPNQLQRFYRGGPAIAAFRGSSGAGDRAPEDWVGSTTAVFGSDARGLSRLADGRVLADAIEDDPQAFLGPGHVERHGSDLGILVKLLDAGERLPVHLHPDRSFAASTLGSPYGKTEAWAIVAAGRPEAHVYVGFREEVETATLERWVVEQDAAALLQALNRLSIRAGDTVFVPAGVPHAIDAGIFLVEVQEASDLSILLEWDGFPIDGAADGHLGLGFERALDAVDRSAWADRLEHLQADRGELRPGVVTLFPAEADLFFRAERLRPQPTVELEAAFSILIIVGGAGELEDASGERTPLRRGDTLLIPYAAGPCLVSGEIEALRCLKGVA